MVDEPIVVGIDIGTTKVCTLVARVEGENNLRILGVGIEPSQGIRKGTIVDLQPLLRQLLAPLKKPSDRLGSKLPPLWSAWLARTSPRSTAGA